MRDDPAFGPPPDLRGTARTLCLVGLGGTLESYDVALFALFIRVIGRLFFPPGMPEWLTQVESFGIFAAGNLARPLGGIVLAHFGDRFGRKRTFMASVLVMAIATLGIAVTPTYATVGIAAPLLLLTLRVLQGAAFGAELPGAWTFIAEHVPAKRVGLACGLMLGGLALGNLLGALVVLAVNTWFSPTEIDTFAWRLPFLLGGILALASVYIRRYLAETPVFLGMARRGELATGLPLAIVLRRHLRHVLMSMALGWLLSTAVVVLATMTPTLLQTLYGIDTETALVASSVSIACAVIGCVLGGPLADRLGSGPFLVLGTPLLAGSTLLFFALLPNHPGWLLPLYALCSLFIGVGVGVPLSLVQSFPAQVRFSGVSFSYTVASAIFSGFGPPLIALGLRIDRMAPAYAVVLPCLASFVVGLIQIASRPKARA
jgi:MFS family permease